MNQENSNEKNGTKGSAGKTATHRKGTAAQEFYGSGNQRPGETVQERAEKYGAVFETVAASIVVTDEEGRIVDINPHYVAHMGKGKTNKNNYTGKNILTHSPVVDAGLVENYKRVLEGKTLDKTDVYFPGTAGGNGGYFDVRGAPILKEGKITGAVFIHEDVTKRKRAEEELRKSVLELKIRNKILEIFHTTPDDQVYKELLNFILEIFKSKYGTFGYFDREGSFVIPSMTREIYWEKCRVPDKDIIFKKGTFTGIWARAIKERKTLYLNEGPFNTPEGHIPIKNTMVTPIIYHDQVISAIHLANKETDYDEGDRKLLKTIAEQAAPVLNARLERDRLEKERRRTEQAILRSEERLAHAQAIAHVGCWENDLDSQEVWWSDELYRIFGVDPGVFKPSRGTVVKLIPAEDLVVMDTAFGAAVSRGEPINLEHRVVRQDGSVRWIHAVGGLKRKADGTPARLFGTSVDITERKKTENELGGLYEQTRRDAETKTLLLQEIDHRVKNNLTSIIGFLYAFQRRGHSGPYRVDNEFVLTLINRIKGLSIVHDMLSRSGWTPLSLADLANRIIHSAAHTLPRNKKMTVEIKPSPVRVTAEQAHNMALVINELVTNTLSHVLGDRDSVLITVKIELQKDNIRFAFQDNGPGLPPEVLNLKHYHVGFHLIKNIVNTNLQGKLSLRNEKGAAVTIQFKKDRRQ